MDNIGSKGVRTPCTGTSSIMREHSSGSSSCLDLDSLMYPIYEVEVGDEPSDSQRTQNTKRINVGNHGCPLSTQKPQTNRSLTWDHFTKMEYS